MNISKMPTNYLGNVDKRTGLGIIVYFLSTFWQLSEASLDADAGVGHRSDRQYFGIGGWGRVCWIKRVAHGWGGARA